MSLLYAAHLEPVAWRLYKPLPAAHPRRHAPTLAIIYGQATTLSYPLSGAHRYRTVSILDAQRDDGSLIHCRPPGADTAALLHPDRPIYLCRLRRQPGGR